MRLKQLGTIITSLFFLLTICSIVRAYPGDLDTTFDTDGIVITPFANADTGQQVAVQADGKIVVVGYSQNANVGYDIALARYNPDGSLDASFGTGGKVFSQEAGDQRGQALLIQPDGKILVVGFVDRTASIDDLAVFRYNTDGSLDSSFGTGGKAIHAILNNARGFDAVLQPDGKIVIAGDLIANDSTRNRFAVFRLNADGSLDTSFNSVGYNFALPVQMTANCLALQPDGKIVVGGQYDTSIGYWGRFNSDGTFEGASLQAISIKIEDVAVQSDGKIVFVGAGGITRYNADKTLDRKFGNFGVNTVSIGTRPLQTATSVVIQPGGRLVVGSYYSGTAGTDSAVARFNSNGFLDVGFGNNGTKVFSTATSTEQITGLALQPDGKIVSVGFGFISGSYEFTVARLDGGGSNTLPNRTPFDYDGDGRADISVRRTSTNVWYNLLSLNGAVGVTTFGASTDITAPADYDGDGRTDIAIWRPSARQFWYLGTASNTIITVYHLVEGATDWIPRPSDFDGDGKADLVLYSPSTSRWSSKSSINSATVEKQFGIAEDKPLIGDFDGDGKGDLAVFRPSTGDWWYASSINGQFAVVHWGAGGDMPSPADVDADGKTDFVVYRPSNGGWYILRSGEQNYTILQFGTAEDKPVMADYDGDGKADVAVFRPSTGIWYLLQTTAGFGAVQWGSTGDIPTPNAFLP